MWNIQMSILDFTMKKTWVCISWVAVRIQNVDDEKLHSMKDLEPPLFVCVCSYKRLTEVIMCFLSSFSCCDGQVTIAYFDIEAELFFVCLVFVNHYSPIVLPNVFALCLWYTSYGTSTDDSLLQKFAAQVGCGHTHAQLPVYQHPRPFPAELLPTPIVPRLSCCKGYSLPCTGLCICPCQISIDPCGTSL